MKNYIAYAMIAEFLGQINHIIVTFDYNHYFLVDTKTHRFDEPYITANSNTGDKPLVTGR